MTLFFVLFFDTIFFLFVLFRRNVLSISAVYRVSCFSALIKAKQSKAKQRKAHPHTKNTKNEKGDSMLGNRSRMKAIAFFWCILTPKNGNGLQYTSVS